MARNFTAAERAAVAALRHGAFSKFEVQDADGTYRDYTQYLRTDWFTGARVSENIDSNTWSLNATLLRETGTLSLSPFVAASLVNRNAGGTYATAIDAWRKWKLSVAVMREGYPPTGIDWKEIAQGRIDVIEWSGDLIQVTGRGEEAVLLDFWIATEQQYGSGGGTAMETVIQTMMDNNLNALAPTLYTPVSPGYNMVTWTQGKGNLFPALQAVASKAGFVLRYRYDASDVYRLTLYAPNRTATPGSEVWTLGPSEYTNVQRVAIDKQGIRNFIKLRYAHSTLGTQTVIYPHMAGVGTVACVAGAATFSTSQAGIIKTAAAGSNTEIIVAGIPYTVTAFNGTTGATLLAQLQTGGVPTFTAAAFTLHDTLSGAGTTTSLSRFGRTDMELDLGFDTQVTDPTKAQAMDDVVGSDMEFPDLEQTIETRGAWFIQLHDYGKFEPNPQLYDSAQYGGVGEIAHDISDGTIRSTIGTRGKPQGGYATWRQLGAATAPGTSTPKAPKTPLIPTAWITPTASSVTTETTDLNGAVGLYGASPLSWQKRVSVTGSAPGSWSAWVVASGGNALPFSVATTRHAKWQTLLEFQVRDANGILSDIVSYVVDPRTAFLHDTSGVPIRATAWDDGKYPLKASDAAGGTADAAVIDSTGRPLNKAFGKVNIGDPDTLDGVPDGATYSKPLATRIALGKPLIDFSEAIHIAKNLDNIADGSTYARAIATRINAGKPVIDFTEAIHTAKNLDNIGDGATYERVAAVVGNLITPLSSSGRTRCRLTLGSAISIPDDAAYHVLAFNTEVSDPTGLHSNVTNNSRITVNASGGVGLWEIQALVTFVSNATGDRSVLILKNGTPVTGDNRKAAGSDSTIIPLTYTDDAPVAGDYYEVSVRQNSGGALNVVSGVGNTYHFAVHTW